MALNFPSPAYDGEIYVDPTSGSKYVYVAASTKWMSIQHIPVTTAFGFDKANSAYLTANAAYDMANAAYNSQNVDYTLSNSAFTHANAAYDFSNSAYASINSNWTVQNALYTVANAAFDSANNVGPQIAPTYNTANAAYTTANAAFSKANNALANVSNVVFSGNLTITGALQVGTGTVRITSNSIDAQSITVAGSAIPSGAAANLAFDTANAAYGAANNVGPQIAPAFNTANAAFASANNVGPQIAPAFNTANAAFGIANTSTQNTASTVFAGSANNTTLFSGISPIAFASALRANRNLTGGGTITVDGSNNVYWGTRFIVLGNGRGSNFSTAGYFDIECPTSGTITGLGGASSVTATASGIPLNTWVALYYILPIGSAQTSLAANFRLVSYTADVDVPYNWMLICWRNGDDNLTYFNNGIRLAPGQSNAISSTEYRISNSSSGYTKFVNGFIVQWGNFSIGDGGTQNVTFPIAFSSACYAVNITQIYQNGADQYQNGVRCTGFPSTTGVSIRQNTNGTNSFFWVAMGF